MQRKTLSASTLIGDGVRNLDGDDLGTIKDLMVDIDGGRVAYAVLDMGGFLGVGNKLFAVPWPALTLDTEAHEFVLDADKETLQNATGFDQENWPDFSDRIWGETVYDHYGHRPFWKV